jgi:cellulose biosynthesis protein BcsQ
MKKPKRQIRLLIASNAGGSGKTTLAVHLAYEVGAKGYKTTLVELDSNSSFRVFLGLNPPRDEDSIASVLRKTFRGDYPGFCRKNDRVGRLIFLSSHPKWLLTPCSSGVTFCQRSSC